MRPTPAKEIEAVLKLDAPARFEHFVKRVVDSESAWGLWKDGWALMTNEDGRQVFPLWPAREYADLCRDGEWADYEPERIPLEALLNELTPELMLRDVCPGVFPTPQGKGVTTTADRLKDALTTESKKYA